MSNTPFKIAVLDASGNRLGGGPLNNVFSLDTVDSLDAIGTASFSVPASDPRTALITPGVQFDIWDEVDGYLGRYFYERRNLSDSGNGQANIGIEAYNALAELSRYTVAFRRSYTYTLVDEVVDDLLAIAPGWTSTIDAAIGHTTVSYEGESVLIAIDELRDRWGKHYRLESGTKNFGFGAFGVDSGVRITNMAGQVPIDIDAHTEIAMVRSIQLVEESGAIFNRIIPLGDGQGVSQLTIQHATAGDYTTQTGTNKDGSTYYYIEDAASIAAYGVHEQVLAYTNIRPITNSDANIEYAANALKRAAEVYIGKNKSPKTTYNVTVEGLRRAVLPGDTVRLVYRGVVDGYGYMDLNSDFYVMDISRKRNVNGTRVAVLEISSVNDRRTSDSDVMIGVIHDLKALKLHVQASICYLKDNLTKRIDSSTPATMEIKLGDEVRALNYAKLKVTTATLKSSVTSVAAAGAAVGSTASGGSSTPTSSSGGGTSTTSGSGGGTTQTSGTDNNTHQHAVFVKDSIPSGYTAYPVSILLKSSSTSHFYHTGYGLQVVNSGTALADHTHDITIPNHTHSITIAAHTHDITIPAHTHGIEIPAHNHAMSYGIYNDTVYPQGISLSINGVDVTAALGGPWAATNDGIEIELDITDYLVNASGGLRQTHELEFTCTGGRGEIVAVCDMLTTIQAIAVA